ncbi:MAG TPA: cold shock domain-containing protein [Ilumatobacteraceae bacterium]|nr:cold shock domain-containing protein [Ilumatobacteraceae bacterium]
MSDTVFGTVVSFDDGMGLGEVKSADGTRLQFHCIELSDGTRSIEVGVNVRFRVISKLGRYEAADVTRA